MQHHANCLFPRYLDYKIVKDLLRRFQAGAAPPTIEIQSDRNLLKPITRHNRVSPFRRKRAKTELIDGAICVFSATVPRRDENRKPTRPKRLSHSRLSPRNIRQLFGICPARSELALPSLTFMVEMPPAVLIQFEQRGRGADVLRQQSAARRRQPPRNHTQIYRRLPPNEKAQQPPQRLFIFIHIIITKEKAKRRRLLLTLGQRGFQLCGRGIH